MLKARALIYSTLLLFAGAGFARGYSVLTHEAVIDAAWDQIKQVLLKKFPGTPPDVLEKAHAYAYGGCIIQDMGYYPFGNPNFSDLVHYVRSGDFVKALLDEAQNVDEMAFALGALAHYSADNNGHPIAVNRAVAIEYPNLRAEYGYSITYDENKTAHLKTEFGFDVVEVAQGHYAEKAYHDFIGFQVSKELLERAFRDTYCLELKNQFMSLDLALGTYRHTVSTILPEATKIAWALHKNDIVKATPGMTKRKFLYNIRRSSYEHEWGNEYRRPGPFARFMAFLLRIIPKVGPFKTVSFKASTPQTERLFMESFNKTLDYYRRLLREAVDDGHEKLANMDFDTGRATREGEYPLADETYGKLLRDLAGKDFKGMTPELRDNLLAFYHNPKPPAPKNEKELRQDRQKWPDTLAALEKLKGLDVTALAAPAR